MTRTDARDFLKVAQQLQLRPHVTRFPLVDANRALLAIKEETDFGSVVLIP